MRLPCFRGIRLRYGCHERLFEVPDEARPIVIAGPNGSGKTTFVEAILRTVYGFSRRKQDERRLLELRQPWSGRPAEGEVELVSAEGELVAIHRDFTTDEVVARAVGPDTEYFRGDGNPAGARSESRRYQELLRDWIGFAELEPYRKTAWVGQGELIETRLDDELLRAAAGTHRRVESALEELQAAYDSLTRESIELGGRRKNRPRELEQLREAAEELENRLARARRAREKRRPLRESARETLAAIEQLDGEIELLEAAIRPLSERRTLLAEERQARDRLAALEEAIRWLREAQRIAESSRSVLAAASAEGDYPRDLESRLGQAVILWERRTALESQVDLVAPEIGTGPGRDDGAARIDFRLAGAGMAAILVALVLGLTVSGLAGLILGVVGATLIGLALRSRLGIETRVSDEASDGTVRRELEAIDARLATLGASIPGPPLTAGTLDLHRERFRAFEAALAEERRAAERLQDAAQQARRLLPGSDDRGSPSEDAGPVARALEAAEGEARTAVARVQLRLEDQPAIPDLPGGVEATVSAVEAARTARRSERADLVERRARLDLELRDMERASEDVFVLDRELARVRDRIAATEEEVEVRRLAWELVHDAYAEFRGQDQNRLLSGINGHLASLSRGRLGPIAAETDLASARVTLGGRSVALDSPPLSFGERHVVLLAIRLGAADFFAGDGLHHPILVDEPFTHLDETHAAEVWGLLTSIAAERQVLVTTQNRLVLRHLGVEPDIELSLPPELARAAIHSSTTDVAGDTRREGVVETGDPEREADGRRTGEEASGAAALPEQAHLDLG